ncbi:MAG: GcrA family cell cycle regulator [Burkholderiales bacterium]
MKVYAPGEDPWPPAKMQRLSDLWGKVPTSDPVPVSEAPAVSASTRVRVSSRDTCAWPFGDPRKPGFHFCGATPVVPGKPYCAAHFHDAHKTPEQAARAFLRH